MFMKIHTNNDNSNLSLNLVIRLDDESWSKKKRKKRKRMKEDEAEEGEEGEEEKLNVTEDR